MAGRYVLRLGGFPADAHTPPGPEGQLIQHITIETDLPQGEVVKRLTDLALAMDAVRNEEPAP
jgi:hypothetical protein